MSWQQIQNARKHQKLARASEERVNHILNAWAQKTYPHKVGKVIEIPKGRGTKLGRITAITGQWENGDIFDNILKPVVRVTYQPVRVDGSDAVSSYSSHSFFWEPK